jgi:hypothetical protein
MGLLPIFLTLTLFVFLWGLVNYNAFAAKRTYIGQLEEETDRLDSTSQEITRRLSVLLHPTHQTAMPGCPESTSNSHALEVVETWRRFVSEHASLQGNEEAVTLLNELEEAATGQYRAHTRLEKAIDDYNRHCRRMPYRLVALLFGFRPIPQRA